MPSHNGSKPPIPFAPGAANVPLVGMPYKLKAIIPQAFFVCQCEAHEPLLLIGLGSACVCPACKRGFKLFGVDANMDTGQANAMIGVGTAQEVGLG